MTSRIDQNHKRQILEDIIYVLLSVIVALIATRIGLVNSIVGAFDGYTIIGIFVAGLFFTSIFTTAPAIALLGGFALESNIFALVFVGALGAVIGDYLIFRFVRDRVAEDVEYVIHANHEEKLFSIFKKRLFRWFVPFLGGLVIASPLPDELGIAMLGLSKSKSSTFLVVSYICNAVGIAVIATVAMYAI